MSDTDKDQEFYDLADAFIALANKQSKNVNPGKVSAVFLYAAARFNTFIVASGTSSANEFSASKANAHEYFVDEYKKMLEEHFTDYHDNFDKYVTKSNNTIN